MEYGKQFTPSNSPPPPGCGLMWEGTTGVTPSGRVLEGSKDMGGSRRVQ